MSKLFTSESVTEGHPDKVCDAISDSVLDAIIGQDPDAHVACESICTTGMALVMGEISTKAYVDIPGIARAAIKKIGYDNLESGFDANVCAVLTVIDEQSPDIAMGVNNALENRDAKTGGDDLTGAGDQGMMFGYACNQTDAYMPAPIYWAHKLTKRLADVRRDGTLPWVLPDGKSQVTIAYNTDGSIAGVPAVVISTQHKAEATLEKVREGIIDAVIKPVIPDKFITKDTKIYVNPTGRFVVGGPVGDSGLTGRKIIVDTYGGYAPHGGGAFSGKDPTKVDRSACYMARYIAKNIVAAGLADECMIELAYAIGVARPVSVLVDTKGTGKHSDERLSAIVDDLFDLRPAAIIRKLNLKRPIYAATAAYGHFGREGFPWEATDMVEALKRA